MKKYLKYNFIYVVLLLLLVNTLSHGQGKIELQAYFKYSIPMGQLAGKWPEDIRLIDSESDVNKNTYHNIAGLGAEIVLKYNLNKKKSLKLSASVIYNYFRQDKVFDHDTTGTSSYFYLNTGMTDWQFAAGIENHFLPKSFLDPFLNFHITVNDISGRQYGQYGHYATSERGGQYFQTEGAEHLVKNIQSAVRLGISIGGGAEFRISKKFGIPVEFDYEYLNLIGKSYTENTSYENINLNDATYTNNGVSFSSKNMMFLGIKAGLTFYPSGH